MKVVRVFLIRGVLCFGLRRPPAWLPNQLLTCCLSCQTQGKAREGDKVPCGLHPVEPRLVLGNAGNTPRAATA